MRYRLRTLLIVLAIGPMVIAAGYFAYESLRPKLAPGEFILDKDGFGRDSSGKVIFRVDPSPPADSLKQ